MEFCCRGTSSLGMETPTKLKETSGQQDGYQGVQRQYDLVVALGVVRAARKTTYLMLSEAA